ncbi:MAG TPA: GTPase HflX, partial [Clostridia bacterium]|nr:GTPase HflX [Clostridia bacterium]
MHNKVNGNISGLRSSILDGLSKLYEINDGPDVFAGEALLERMAALTHAINREISVYIRRNGVVADVSVGSAASVLLPELRLVRNELRLSGVRCIHTHPQHGAHLSAVDIGTLKALRLDAMAALGIANGRADALCAAFLGDWEEDGFKVLRYGPVKLSAIDQRRLISEIYEADARVRALSAEVLEKQPERAVLVSLEQSDASYSMKELRALASTAGA